MRILQKTALKIKCREYVRERKNAEENRDKRSKSKGEKRQKKEGGCNTSRMRTHVLLHLMKDVALF